LGLGGFEKGSDEISRALLNPMLSVATINFK
jgi:hypothetical protein